MNKKLLTMTISICLLISGCSSGLQNLDNEWGIDNREIQNKLGVKIYNNISKEKAMSAMLVAFQRLDLIVENTDFETGFISAMANAPKPLTHDEFEQVKKIEDGRARKHALLFSWNLRDFKSKLSVVFLRTQNDIQISLRANLHFVGDRYSLIPVTEFPPEATRIAFVKIWNEFEKVAFIQEKTISP
ncbi:MAG: hypothetical protein KAJ18_11100 [Candidatus Omnitrophica bacterium]|nr:hypothetical protein [Candidatus Omnitrophota bacterium]